MVLVHRFRGRTAVFEREFVLVVISSVVSVPNGAYLLSSQHLIQVRMCHVLVAVLVSQVDQLVRKQQNEASRHSNQWNDMTE